MASATARSTWGAGSLPPRFAAGVAGILVAIAAALVLASWSMRVGAGRTLLPGLPPMGAAAALAFVCGGATLYLAWFPPTRARRLVGALGGAMVAAFGVLEIAKPLQQAWALDRLDALLPGDTSPLSALCFGLLGLALVVTHALKRGARLAEGLALVALLVPLFVLVAYLYGFSAPRIGPFSSMPLGSAVAFVVLGVGILLANPGGRVMERFVSPSAGGASARLLLPSVILVPLAMGGLLVVGRALGFFGEHAGNALHTLGTILALASLAWLTSGRLQRVDALRERALENVRASEARFKALGMASAHLLWLLGADGRPKDDSPSWRLFTGQSREDWLAGRWADCLHPDDRERVTSAWKGAFSSGQTLEVEYRLRRPDGSYTWTLARSAPLLDERGRPHEWIGTNTDITNRKRAELALAASNRRLQVLAEVSQELAAAGLDAELVASAVVSSVCELLGDGCVLGVFDENGALTAKSFCHRDPVAHREGREILLAGPVPMATSLVARALAARQTMTFDQVDKLAPDQPERVRRFLETLRVRSLIVAPLLEEDRPVGALAALRGEGTPPFDADERFVVEDLARRALLALENVQLYERAQTAIRLRDEFLSVASHELRTPLTTLKLQVSAMLHELRRTPAAPGSLERFQRLDVQVDRMTRLVNQLLDVSRIVDGRLALEPQEVDLRALAQEIVDWFRDQAARARCPIVLSGAPRVVGQWDASRIGQVLTNLLSNALKYGAGHPIEVSVEQDGDEARLVVSDHGIGVAAEDQQRIFERFERAASVRNYGGLGLGLWIAKEIVEKHGGRIRVESRPREGASFIVELPLQAPARTVTAVGGVA